MEEEEARKRALLYELEDEFIGLLKRRGWILALVLAILGVGGIWVTVQYTVDRVAAGPLADLQRQLIRAEIEAENAKRAGATATAAADRVSISLKDLQDTIQTLKQQAGSVANQFSVLGQQIDAASKNAALRSERDFSAIQQRISALEELVKQTSAENAATRKAAADYAARVAALERKVEKEQKRFAENSTYKVIVYSAPEKKSIATQATARLAAAGFRASYSEFPFAAKKTMLSYPEGSESKAQEIAALLKSVVANIELNKFPDSVIAKSYYEALGAKLNTVDIPGVKFLGVWSHEPNNFVLMVAS